MLTMSSAYARNRVTEHGSVHALAEQTDQANVSADNEQDFSDEQAPSPKQNIR